MRCDAITLSKFHATMNYDLCKSLSILLFCQSSPKMFCVLVYVWVSMYSIYNQTWPNQALESQPLHRGSLKITCSDHLTHTTAKSILWAWDLLYPVLPSKRDSLQNSVRLLCHANLSAPVYLSPKVSFSDLLSLIPPFFCPPVPSLFSAKFAIYLASNALHTYLLILFCPLFVILILHPSS